MLALVRPPAGLPDPVFSAAVEDVAAGLLALFLLFVAAKVGEEVARRLGQPAVIGELAGGFLVGPHAFALVVPTDTVGIMAELGVVILLFTVGLEVRVDQLLAVGRAALAVGFLGMVLPIGAGIAVMLLVGDGVSSAAFVGLALAATSIGITSRVLADMGVLDRAYSRVILGAAIVDDILVLIAIGVVSGAARGELSATTLLVAVSAIGLLALGFAIARRARGLKREVFTWPLFADTPLVPAFLLMLGVGLLAAQIGLAAIIGAFVAGLIVAETEARDEIEHEMRPLLQIFTPFFFAATGAALDLSALVDPEVAVLAIGLAAVGVVTKLVGGYLGARSLGSPEALVVGAGMIPRGEVGIVVANLGLAGGLLVPDLFSAVLVAVVLTTVIAPFLLRWAVPRAMSAAP